MSEGAPTWPALPVAEWHATRDTLQLWTQIVGKVRLARTPTMSHWWNVPLYVTARGLTTSMIPANGRGFQIDFDFTIHELEITVSDGQQRTMRLEAWPVAGLLHQRDGNARRPRTVDAHLDDARRDPRRDPVREGPHPCLLRPSPGRAVLAGTDRDGPRVHSSSAPSSSARSAPSTCSGEGSTSRSPGSPAGPHHHTPVAHPTAART